MSNMKTFFTLQSTWLEIRNSNNIFSSALFNNWSFQTSIKCKKFFHSDGSIVFLKPFFNFLLRVEILLAFFPRRI